MADNVEITPGTGAVISTDELTIDAVAQQVQRVKIGLGANNAWDMDLDSGQQTMANSIPVAIASDQSSISMIVTGTTAVSGIVNITASSLDLMLGTDFSNVLGTASLTLSAQQDDLSNNTDSTVTTALLYGFDGTAWDRLQGDATNGLLVNLGTNNDVTITSIAAGDNNIGNVDIASVPAPLSTTGGGTEATALRVTIASDSTGLLSIDDNGGAITVDGTVAVTHTALTELGDTINGNQLDVDIKASDVDLMLGTDFSAVLGAASLILATQADDVANTTDTLLTSSFLYGFDGTAWDRLRGDSTNGLLVNLGTNTTTLSNMDSRLTGIQENLSNLSKLVTSNVSPTDYGVPSYTIVTASGIPGTLGKYYPLSTSAINGRLFTTALIDSALPAGTNNIGDVDILTVPAPLSTTGGGTEATALRVTIASDSTGVLSVDDNGGALTVDGTITANAGTNLNTSALALEVGGNLAAIKAKTDNIPGLGQAAMAASTPVTIASNQSAIPITVATIPSHAVTNAGTFAVQAATAGIAADGAAASGNPVLMGAVAETSEKTGVDDGDAVSIVADKVGKLVTLPYATSENFISGATNAITDTTRTAVIAAAGSGVRNFITHVIVSNSHASVGTLVTIEDGTTALYKGYAAPGGGGFSITLPVPLKGTANTAINATCGTTGSNIYVSASGYKGV